LLSMCQRLQVEIQLLRQLDRQPPDRRACGYPASSNRQGQPLRHLRQGSSPVLAPPPEPLAAHLLSLTADVIRELPFERRQRILRSLAIGAVEQRELSEQNAHGPGVRDDLVLAYDQDVLQVTALHELAADERAAPGIEDFWQLRLLQCKSSSGWPYLLDERSVPGSKCRPQDLVPRDDTIESRLKCCSVERTTQAHVDARQQRS